MLVNIPVKFHCDILNGFRVTERTRFVTDRLTDNQGKNNMSPTPSSGDIILHKVIDSGYLVCATPSTVLFRFS